MANAGCRVPLAEFEECVAVCESEAIVRFLGLARFSTTEASSARFPSQGSGSLIKKDGVSGSLGNVSFPVAVATFAISTATLNMPFLSA